MSNLYWSVYQGLEREVIALSEKIHFDDKQVEVYSVKMVELIIRCVVEIESIVKELYNENNGAPPNEGENLYFDTDCIKYLEKSWKLSKKKVLITSSSFHFTKDENMILTPFNKASNRGTSSSNWQKAYQAVKHNRALNLSKGNIKNLMSAMAALYLANIYYKNIYFDMDNDSSGTSFDSSLGSSIFSIELHIDSSISSKNVYFKKDDFDECTYISLAIKETKKDIVDLYARNEQILHARVMANLGVSTLEEWRGLSSVDEYETEENIINLSEEELKKMVEKERNNIMVETTDEAIKFARQIKYKIVLNKNEF